MAKTAQITWRTVCDSCLTALDGLHTSKGAKEIWNTIIEENWDAWRPDKIMVQLSKRFRKYMPVHQCDSMAGITNKFGIVVYNCECSGYLVGRYEQDC